MKKEKKDYNWIWQGFLCILILLCLASVWYYFIGPIETSCICEQGYVNAFMPIKYMNEKNWNDTLICDDFCEESNFGKNKMRYQ